MSRLPWIAAAGFLFACALWLSNDRRVPREAFVAGSVQNEGPEGMSLARAYLERGGRKTSTLARPLERAFLAKDAVLFRVAPGAPPLKKDAAPVFLSAAEEAWVAGGGRLVLAVSRDYGILRVSPSTSAPVKAFPAWPGARELRPPTRRALSGPPLDEAVALWTSGDAVFAARQSRGRGDVVLLASPEILFNAAIGDADHLALLEALAGKDRELVFDEHAHGLESGAGTMEILRAWGFGPSIALAALAAAAAFWRGRRRLGPPEDDARETRVEAVEFVDSLALLYDRALDRRQALELYRRAFERELGARTHLRGDALRERAAALLGRGARPPAPEGRGADLSLSAFELALEAANDAFRRLDHEERRGR